MIRHIARSLTFLLVCLAASACGAFEFQGQELALRHDPAADTLRLELLYRGVDVQERGLRYQITPAEAKSLREAMETGDMAGFDDIANRGGKEMTMEQKLAKARVVLKRMAGRERYFMLFFNTLWFDLEAKEKRLHEALATDAGDWERTALELCQRVDVLEAQVFVAADGTLGVRQVIRLKQVSATMASLNTLLHQLVKESALSGKLVEQQPNYIDDATREAFLADARAGRSWISWSGEDLVIDLPVTEQSAAGLMKYLLNEVGTASAEKHSFFQPFYGLVTKLSVSDGRLILTLGANATGVLQLDVEMGHPPSPQLLNSLREHDFDFDPDPTVQK